LSSGPTPAALGTPADQGSGESKDALAGNDVLFGDAGNNVLRGGAGDDEIHGAAGDDVISGDAGSDRIFGDAGNDDLDGGEGNDIVSGGDGNDLIAGGSGDDQIDGGAGEDVLDLSGTTLGVIVDLDTGAVSGVEIGSDTIANIEQILGGTGDDIFVLGTGSVQIVGGAGNDLYEVATGADYVLVLVGDTTTSRSATCSRSAPTRSGRIAPRTRCRSSTTSMWTPARMRGRRSRRGTITWTISRSP
jgi:Ca2+-binding RTX toxin-like protein